MESGSKTLEEEALAGKVDSFTVSADRKRILYSSKDVLGIVDAGKFKVGDGKLPVGSVSVRVDPQAEGMMIDESAGSGGDRLLWMFRRFKLGTLVGRRTWGGPMETLGFPGLMDGGTVTAPNIGSYTEDGWRVKNEGVPPDVEVEHWPAEVAAGKNPQLEKAIDVALEQLEAHPRKELPRPEYPVRVRSRGGRPGHR